MDHRRVMLGTISGLFIAIGGLGFFFQWDGTIYGVLLRSGLSLGAIWLALPELTSKNSKLTTPALILCVGLIIVIAIRPRLFLVFGTLAIVGFLLQGVVRRFTAGLKK